MPCVLHGQRFDSDKARENHVAACIAAKQSMNAAIHSGPGTDPTSIIRKSPTIMRVIRKGLSHRWLQIVNTIPPPPGSHELVRDKNTNQEDRPTELDATLVLHPGGDAKTRRRRCSGD